MINRMVLGKTLVQAQDALKLDFSVSFATFRGDTFEKIAFILLNQVDIALTFYALSLGLSELNPVMQALVRSPLELMAVKLLVPALIAWLTPGKLLIPAILLLCLIVGWDMKELVLFFL
jgi:hypothetical protein